MGILRGVALVVGIISGLVIATSIIGAMDGNFSPLWFIYGWCGAVVAWVLDKMDRR
jgi:hypothetical protein